MTKAIPGLICLICVLCGLARGQDTLKIFIEEVRIPITAKDSGGRFDPTVETNDLLLRENGVVQPLKSVYRTPANVVLLLDTGGEFNLAKNVRLTREVAASFVSDLQRDDQLAVIQVNNALSSCSHGPRIMQTRSSRSNN
jgi:hypothetical protein